MRDMSAPPGWYSDPEMAGTRRYWDGETWTDHRAPTEAKVAPPPSFMTQARVIAVGILIAIAVVFVVYRLAHSTDGVDCATKNMERAQNGQPLLDCG